ncbi:MAG: hypothetical protein ACLU8F_02210 [Clostridia bacterium]
MTKTQTRKINIHSEKGFTGVDLTIAILILVLFVSIITTIFYNIYISSTSIKRSTIANGYAMDILEAIDKENYEAIYTNSPAIQNIIQKEKIARGYTVTVAVEKYNETTGNTDKEDLVKTVTVTVEYKVGIKPEKVTMSKLKTAEVPYRDSLGIMPKLVEGMQPVKYVITNQQTGEGYWQATTSSDPEWFDYEKKQWANVMLQDGLEIDTTSGKVTKMGSMLVYIPRYAYKIPKTNYHTNMAGTIDIKFLNTNNTCKDGSKEFIETEATSGDAGVEINSSTNYMQHPAFTFGDTQLEGIWVGKFESSRADAGTTASNMGTNTQIAIKPNVTSWRNISVNDIFNNCINMKAISAYGITTSIADTHMMKNIEWGAVVYLAQSKYGKNAKIMPNNSIDYITGNAANTANDIEISGVTNAYQTIKGQQASTTGNIYGIYDMSGGALEYVAAYIEGLQSVQTNANNLLLAASKYKDVYAQGVPENNQNNYNANKMKYGDAIWETSNGYANNNGSWNMEYSNYPFTNFGVFGRGGRCQLKSNSGIFFFSYNSGIPDSTQGFRVCLVAE